ncbi:MAG: LuxR family transcriptional regulator [Flavobacterium sp.]|nr:MAG: LuxR family transcriptional regulator [Flavobacterium sp.]
MVVPGTELHMLTLVIIVLELMMLPFVLWYYYAWPKDKSRLWYFLLLFLLVVYNLTGGLFPDPDIVAIPFRLQNTIAYGSGFLMASFFPYYFYKCYHLDALRWHAIYGVPAFLLLPYLVFFCIVYPVTGDLDYVINYGMIVPSLYVPVLLWAMLKSMRIQFRGNDQSLYPSQKLEMLAMYWAVAPWALMTVFSYLHVEQWIEVLATNTGFVVITVLSMLRSGRMERMEKERLLTLTEMSEKQLKSFEERCLSNQLTRREGEVAQLLCQGLTYAQISENLFIAKRTVDTHVQNIFFKTGVNKKIELQKILGIGG